MISMLVSNVVSLAVLLVMMVVVVSMLLLVVMLVLVDTKEECNVVKNILHETSVTIVHMWVDVEKSDVLPRSKQVSIICQAAALNGKS